MMIALWGHIINLAMRSLHGRLMLAFWGHTQNISHTSGRVSKSPLFFAVSGLIISTREPIGCSVFVRYICCVCTFPKTGMQLRLCASGKNLQLLEHAVRIRCAKMSTRYGQCSCLVKETRGGMRKKMIQKTLMFDNLSCILAHFFLKLSLRHGIAGAESTLFYQPMAVCPSRPLP